MSPSFIREQDPLKQGLKHNVYWIINAIWGDSWARSTKTRIETDTYRREERREADSWARSTKTRIETRLRPSQRPRRNMDSWARSTKTRIETVYLFITRRANNIREQNPLKQGLKQTYNTEIAHGRYRREVASTKTRIETFSQFTSSSLNIWSRSSFH